MWSFPSQKIGSKGRNQKLVIDRRPITSETFQVLPNMHTNTYVPTKETNVMHLRIKYFQKWDEHPLHVCLLAMNTPAQHKFLIQIFFLQC